jgi:hypothetical protein
MLVFKMCNIFCTYLGHIFIDLHKLYFDLVRCFQIHFSSNGSYFLANTVFQFVVIFYFFCVYLKKIRNLTNFSISTYLLTFFALSGDQNHGLVYAGKYSTTVISPALNIFYISYSEILSSVCSMYQFLYS